MLKGVQPERGQRRGVLMPEHPEDPALLAKSVVWVAVGETRGSTPSDGNRHAGL